MEYLTGAVLYILYGLFGLLSGTVSAQEILAFLGAIILSCLVSVLTRRWAAAAPVIIYAACFLFLPSFLGFFPLCVFVSVDRRLYHAAALTPVFYIAAAFIHEAAFITAAKELTVAATAAVLSLTLVRLNELRLTKESSSDSSRESELLLRDKNRALMEKQEYEIHNATLRERNRIAREIHDNVGHMLSRSILLVGALKTLNRDEGLKELFSELDGSLNTAMDNIRESVHDLHDESIDLQAAVRGLLEVYTFCGTELIYDCGYELPREVKYSFLAIIKEALANTARHSDASLIQITIREHPALYQLRIEDNGHSAEKKSAAKPGSDGIGLSNMRERVGLIGGTINIKTDDGFRIFITVPKKETGAEKEN